MKLKKNKQKIKIYIRWVVVVLYLAMIFYFSSQDGTKSHKVSSELLQYLKFLVVLIPERIQRYLSGTYRNMEFILRKAAHFTEYFILSFVFYRAMVISEVRVKKSMIVTLVFCFLYAVSDEVHQVFVPGRAFAVGDIIIDTLGAALGIIVIFFKNLISGNIQYKKRH
ncbi:MAG: VanZ family protein [Firmicutes bacterium]|nr:VanZ family protein [Bacillota bacterium]